MTQDGFITLFILGVTTFLFIWGRIRSDFVALLCLLSLILTEMITPKEALAGFSNSAVIMIAALFIVGAGIFRTGLAETISSRCLKVAGTNETALLLVTMIVTGLFSAFLSNTGTVALLLPVVVSLANKAQISPAKLLIPLAFASSLGGAMTLIGTPPNLMVSEKLASIGEAPLSFFSFTPIGIFILAIGILFFLLFGNLLLPKSNLKQEKKRISLHGKWEKTFGTANHVHTLQVPKKSPVQGQTLQNLNWSQKYNVQVLEVERSKLAILDRVNHQIAVNDSRILENDILYIQGATNSVAKLATENNIVFLNKNGNGHSLVNESLGVAEFIITPHSSFNGATLQELSFRSQYQLNVVSIHRNGSVITRSIHKLPLAAGDALLVHGSWDKLDTLAKLRDDVVVLHLPAEEKKETASNRQWIAGGIILAMIVAMAFEWFDPVTISLIAAMAMIFTGCLGRTKNIYSTIQWDSIILIAAMLPLSTALENSGAVAYIANSIVDTLGSSGPLVVLAAIYILTNVFSQMISNTATAILCIPIAINAAQSLDVSLYPFVVAVALGASMAFATPVASPTNAMVMNSGNYKFSDYVKVGIPLQIVLGIFIILTLPLFFPF